MDNLSGIYKGKKILVTGHTGFKGCWLSRWLVELGAEVIGYSLEPPTDPNLFEVIKLEDKITHIIGDVREQKHLQEVFRRHKPEFVFHLAAQSSVRVSYKEPKLTYETNIMGPVNILETIRTSDSVRVCIVITSDKCYENKERVDGYKETDVLGGYDPYSSSKACAELVVSAYRRSFFNPKAYGKTHHVALSSARAGNIIGGGDWTKDRLVVDCVKALSRNETIVIRNPEATRPWNYVLESLSGYLWMAGFMHKHAASYSDAWNFGPLDKKCMSVEELVNLIIKIWGKGSYRIDSSSHPHEAVLLHLDINKAINLLGWKPVYNTREALRRTINWYKFFYNKASAEQLDEAVLAEIKEYSNRMNKEIICPKS